VALAVTPLTLGWKISVTNATMAIVLYVISGFGISLGFHRYLTHGSFKAGRVMRAVLAVSGSLAIAGAPSQWVATIGIITPAQTASGTRTRRGATGPARSRS